MDYKAARQLAIASAMAINAGRPKIQRKHNSQNFKILKTNFAFFLQNFKIFKNNFENFQNFQIFQK